MNPVCAVMRKRVTVQTTREKTVPFQGFRMMTSQSIPKLANGEKSGFQLDCEAIVKVAPFLKQMVNFYDFEPQDDMEQEWLDIVQAVKDFVKVFFPPIDNASEDDMPVFDAVRPPNRAERRAESKRRAHFDKEKGQWV